MDPLLKGAVVRSGMDPAVIADAIVRLRAGRLVAIPTETVYGLAAPTFDATAIARIYEYKGRPSDNPLIAHVADVEMARAVVTVWPDEASALADACWPGPLTIVLPKAGSVPEIATGGRDSVGVRMPAHHVTLDLLRRFGGPLSAPSANRSGSISPTEARHVLADFVDRDLVILDGGPCRVGLESTVLDLRPVLDGGTPMVLRPGAVSASRIAAILGRAVESPEISGQADAPGTRSSHYAPSTPVRRCGLEESGGEAVAVIVVGGAPDEPRPHRDARWRLELPDDPDLAGGLLYAAFHAADVSGSERIDIVGPPSESRWHAVEDRIARAAAAPSARSGDPEIR
jgi:L-threonylcarbamoyladenylate synthase